MLSVNTVYITPMVIYLETPNLGTQHQGPPARTHANVALIGAITTWSVIEFPCRVGDNSVRSHDKGASTLTSIDKGQPSLGMHWSLWARAAP